MADLLHVLARRTDGKIVHIDDATKDENYFCPECGGTMLLRRGERGLRRPHFAHLQLSEDCTPETVLHRVFKERLAALIEKRMTSGESLPFQWHCSYCGGKHAGDLTRTFDRVAVEHPMEITRPDIALFTPDGQVKFVIEVVVTHKPTLEAMNYYEENEMYVLQVYLDNHDDLNILNETPLLFTKMNICFNPKCGKCERHMKPRYMKIITGPCLRCTGHLKIAFMMDGDYTLYVPRFSDKQLEVARQNGVIVKEHYKRRDYRTSKPLLGCGCPHCGYFIEERHTLSSYIIPARERELQAVNIQMGYVCVYCYKSESFYK